MAAGEDQPQHVVVEHGVRFLAWREGVELELMDQLLLLAAKGDIAADAVDRLVAPDIDQPGARVLRQLAGRPAFQRHRKGILQHILGEIEIADEADQRGHRPARLVAEDLFDFDRGHCGANSVHSSFRGVRSTSPESILMMVAMDSGLIASRCPGMTIWRHQLYTQIGRTSIEPVRAPGIRAAIAIAVSRSFASIM